MLFTQKAGCTFAVKWFFEQIGVLAEATAYSNWIHDYREQVFYASKGYRPEDIAAPAMRVLKFVRNPFSRAVSSYVQANKMGYEDAKIQRFLGRPVTQEQRYSFREFVAHLGSVDLRTCNVHHRLQLHPLEENGLVRPTHVVPIEQSHELLTKLEQELELAQTNNAKLASSVHHTTRSVDASFCGDERFVIPRGRVTMPSTGAFYDPDIERAVARLYREDFERYGYAPERGA